ncbi:hypothetical protein TNCV_947961 [Trichonephila clavipes]|nr:hypothetical protein TNCV_947961 [Trichonephila clavipes]
MMLTPSRVGQGTAASAGPIDSKDAKGEILLSSTYGRLMSWTGNHDGLASSSFLILRHHEPPTQPFVN